MNKPAYSGLSILEKKVMHEFWYKLCEKEFWRKKIKLRQEETFPQTLQKLLKQDLILQIGNQTDHYLDKKVRKLLNFQKMNQARK